MKKLIYKIIRFFISILPIRKIILCESNPDFSCNTYPVYKEIKNRTFFKKYKIIWLVSDKSKYNKNCIQKKPKNFFENIVLCYYRGVAKCIISCNSVIQKQRKNQLSVFLAHGSKTKKTKGICEIGRAVDYVLCQSHFFDEIIKYEYDLVQQQLIYLGYPRCDCFFKCNKDVHNIIGVKSDAKYFIWLPTFRVNSAYSNYDTISDYEKIGMPIIYSVDELKKLNDLLQKNNMYIIFKPHPAQDVSTLKAVSLTNIFVIDDKWLADRNLLLYEVIAKSSALITDYSSVFFDYLLLDKPIATTTDDIDEWKKKRGFAFDLDAMYDKATIRIPDYTALERFILDVYNGIDSISKQRAEICKLTNIYNDGDSAQRVADFIENELKKR